MIDIFTSRRDFISNFLGLIPGMVLVNPKYLQTKKPEIKHFLRQIELETLKSSKPERDSTIICRTFGKTSILYREKKGEREPLCSMNLMGKVIWEACDGGKRPEDISKLIQERYAVSQSRAFLDTLDFLGRLKRVGAVF